MQAYPSLGNIAKGSLSSFVYFVGEYDADVVLGVFSAVAFVVLLGRVPVLRLAYQIPLKLHCWKVGRWSAPRQLILPSTFDTVLQYSPGNGIKSLAKPHGIGTLDYEFGKTEH